MPTPHSSNEQHQQRENSPVDNEISDMEYLKSRIIADKFRQEEDSDDGSGTESGNNTDREGIEEESEAASSEGAYERWGAL